MIKYKHTILLFICSWLVILVGMACKIFSFRGAGEYLAIGYILLIVSLLMVIIKMINNQDPNSFLNH